MPRISKDQLITLQKKYRTDEAIGKLFNISRQAVHQLRHKYGIEPVADKHHERNREIIRLHHEGMGPTRLARTFGISVSQAYRIVRKAGPKEQPPPSRHTDRKAPDKRPSGRDIDERRGGSIPTGGTTQYSETIPIRS